MSTYTKIFTGSKKSNYEALLMVGFVPGAVSQVLLVRRTKSKSDFPILNHSGQHSNINAIVY
jgi:hypothetical protein